MRRLLILAVFIAGSVLAFNLGRKVPTEDIPSPGEPAAAVDLGASVDEPAPQLPEPVRVAHLRRIAGIDTYMPVTLVEADSVVRRWVDRENRPLRVFFEPTQVSGYTPELGRAARDAFARWSRVAEIPVVFRLVDEPEGADVTVRWVRAFSMRREGQADLMWRGDGHLQRSTLTLATHTSTGVPLPRDAVFTVALHEIGHLLGLGHSDQPRDVMYPTTSVVDLTARDRRTAMLLYSLPPGSLKAPSAR